MTWGFSIPNGPSRDDLRNTETGLCRRDGARSLSDAKARDGVECKSAGSSAFDAPEFDFAFVEKRSRHGRKRHQAASARSLGQQPRLRNWQALDQPVLRYVDG